MIIYYKGGKTYRNPSDLADFKNIVFEAAINISSYIPLTNKEKHFIMWDECSIRGCYKTETNIYEIEDIDCYACDLCISCSKCPIAAKAKICERYFDSLWNMWIRALEAGNITEAKYLASLIRDAWED